MTNFHQLHIFHAVPIHGSFSKAAVALSISQPAISI
jgi:DNA-binding transcriptional LysR family regulator